MAPWHPSKYTRAQLEERRLAALSMIQAGGHTNQQIADHFGVSIHTVYTGLRQGRCAGSQKG